MQTGLWISHSAAFGISGAAARIGGTLFTERPSRTHIDATHGSDALKSGALQKAISAFIEKLKPEATYSGRESGQRTALSVFDMEGSHQCPEVAEGFFGTGCDVHSRHA